MHKDGEQSTKENAQRTARKSTYTLFVICAYVAEKLGRESKRKTNTLNYNTIVMQFNMIPGLNSVYERQWFWSTAYKRNM